MHDQRFLDEAAQQIEHVDSAMMLAARTHGFRRLQRPAAGEHREAAEQDPLLLGQQVVAPVDQRPQGLLARQRGPVAACQQTEAVRQALGDLLHRKRAQARRGELDRQRNAVQAPTDFGHGRGIPVGDAKGRLRRDRALDEQVHRFELHQGLGGDCPAVIGDRERRHRIVRLARDVQRLAAGRQDLQTRARLQHLLRELGAGVDQVFAIVEDEQQSPVLDAFISASDTGRPASSLTPRTVATACATSRASAMAASSTNHTPSG